MKTNAIGFILRTFMKRQFVGVLILSGLVAPILSQEARPNGAEPAGQVERRLQDLTGAVGEADLEPAPAQGSRRGAAAREAKPVVLGTNWLGALAWRSIGPANMGGRIVDLAVVESDPSTYWIATAGGGLLKTTNNGVTFTHQFDRETTVSIGAVTVAPSDPKIVWVGTGENNPRNSVSYGDGVYKSTDGGKTWKNMGLKKSYQTGRIVIHPKNPNVVYIGALGRLWGPNEERGVFKTSDGGETWEKSLYVDDKTGVVDLVMHPAEPETLIAAMYDRLRDGYDSHPGDPMPDGYDSYDPIKKWGPTAGIYKTTDGGRNWRRLTNGLPTSSFGRIGLDYYRKSPNTVFAIVDCEKIGMGTPPSTNIVDLDIAAEDVEGGARLASVRENGPSARAGLQTNDVVKAVDDKPIASADQLLEELRGRKPEDKLKFKLQRGNQTVELEMTLARRVAGTNAVYVGLNAEDAEEGLKITTAVADGPAASAGIKTDDVIQAVGGMPVSSLTQMMDELRTRNIGDKVKFKVLREEQSQEIEVTLGDSPGGARGGGRGRGGGGGGAGGRGGNRTRPYGATYGGQQENIQDQQGTNSFEYGGIYKSTDGGETWKRINSFNPRPMYFSLLRVDPSDDRNLYVGGVSMFRSSNGGRTFRTGASSGVHADHHSLWINPRDGRHMIVGSDGGAYVTYDRTANWDHLNTTGIGQFYHISISLKEPYYVAGGLQDNGSWMGPSAVLNGSGPINEDWINVGGGDGFVCRVDPNDPDLVYSESQNGTISRRNLRTGERGTIRPVARGGGGGGGRGGPGAAGARGRRGGGEGETQAEGEAGIAGARRGAAGGAEAEVAETGGQRGGPGGAGGGRGGGGGGGGTNGYRFNWNTPFILSSHNSRIFYSAGNFVFRSLDRGNNLQAASPEITFTKWGSGTALSESPTNANVLYAGTDDGALWVTRDGTKTWTNITDNVGLPGRRWVSTIEASRFAEGRAYVAFDGHRSDDDNPYVYVTEDFGQTWKSIRANLPWGSTRVLREDLRNPDLLYVGTEFGAWFSLDRGQNWNKLGTNLPTVAVHEFAIHPANGEIVAATHGRSLWVLDVSALRQIKADHLVGTPALYKPSNAVKWRTEAARGRTNRRFVGQNPSPGAPIYYALPAKAEKVSLRVMDIEGRTIRELATGRDVGDVGLHRATWDLRSVPPRPANTGARGAAQPGAAGEGEAARGRGGQGGGGGGGRGGGGGGAAVPAGAYRVVLNVDGQEFTQTIRVEADPVVPETGLANEGTSMDDEDAMDEDEEESEEEMEREAEIRSGGF